MARTILHGLAISPGIAIGPLLLLPESRIGEKRHIPAEAVEAEVEALNAASARVCEALTRATTNLPEDLADYREMLATQQELARDPRILEGAAARIGHKKICAAWAIDDTISELSELFQGMADPYLSDRAQDIRAIGKCLINALRGDAGDGVETESGVLAAWEISPATFMDFRPDGIIGLVTVDGGATSHTAILARALKAPAVIGVSSLAQEARKGEMVIVDGFSGQVVLGPDAREIAHYTAVGRKHATFEREARVAAHRPAVTRDGIAIGVMANLENPQELGAFHISGAEGVGLYRTEFAYLRNELPTEDQLLAEYRTVLAGTRGKKTIFRALDVGADKILPAPHSLQEPNPALGLRGIRFCLRYPDIFRPQLRALLRAAADAPLAIMIPMVTTLKEVRAVRALIVELAAELAADGLPHDGDPPVGIMLETPAAALICDELARECDFISIGTNDLLHYMMAIDRCNRHVSYLHEPLHPAFLRAIDHVVAATHASGKQVSVCGELAADPLGMALLLGLGVDALSAAPHFVPQVKHLLRQLDAKTCRDIAQKALAGAEPSEIRTLLRDMTERSVGGELLLNSVIK